MLTPARISSRQRQTHSETVRNRSVLTFWDLFRVREYGKILQQYQDITAGRSGVIRTLDPHVPNGGCCDKTQRFWGRRFRFVLACSTLVQRNGTEAVREKV